MVISKFAWWIGTATDRCWKIPFYYKNKTWGLKHKSGLPHVSDALPGRIIFPGWGPASNKKKKSHKDKSSKKKKIFFIKTEQGSVSFCLWTIISSMALLKLTVIKLYNAWKIIKQIKTENFGKIIIL